MTTKIAGLIAVGLCLSLTPARSATQLIVGGDFESPVITGTGASAFLENVTPTGWIGTGTLVVQGFGLTVSSGNGNQWFALNPSNNGIRQSINVTGGTTYNFSFLYNGGSDLASGAQIAYIIALTDSLTIIQSGAVFTNGHDFQRDPWATFSTSFTPTSDDVTLFLVGAGFGGTFIDAVSVTTPSVPDVPLPAALPLFATGLGALGLLGWRRKRKAGA